jgi:hypothetical protein
VTTPAFDTLLERHILRLRAERAASRHKLISFVKSGMRLVASALLIPFAPVPAWLLIAAEVFGVIEEIGT